MPAAETTPGTEAPGRPTPSAFWLAFWLLPPLIGAKAAHWGWPHGAGEWRDFVRDLAISSSADVAFAIGFGLLAALLLRAVRSRPRLAWAVALASLTLGAFCTLYAMASVQIFSFLRSPLTYPLLCLASDMRTMGSSIGSFATPLVLATLALAPVLYVVAVLYSPRYVRCSTARRLTTFGLVASVAAASSVGIAASHGRWSDRADHLIAKSPHYEFLASLVHEARGGGAPDLDVAFSPEFLDDFRPRPESTVRGLALPASTTTMRPMARRPKNALLIVLESTGAQHLGVYGSPYDTTPHLTAEAKHAIVFDNAYCHVGLTANSMAAISLSIYPYMTWREYTVEYPELPGETVAGILAAHDYRTGYFMSGLLDYTNQRGFLANRGFQRLEDWYDLGHAPLLNSWGGTDDRLVDRTLAWIDEDPARPFYGLLWTTQSHHPYDAVPGEPEIDFFQGRERPPDDWDLGRYLNTLRYVDAQLGRLFDGLRARGLDKDTLVIITGDHGEAFGDPHETWGHGSRLFEENVRVPLVVWSPTLFPMGGRSRSLAGHVDLSPTILHLLGHPAPMNWQGRSLFRRDRPDRAYFYAANDDYLLGLREGDWKYIYNVTQGRDVLFDLANDPKERSNVAEGHAALCATYRQRVAAWRRHAGEHLAQARAEMDARRPGARNTTGTQSP